MATLFPAKDLLVLQGRLFSPSYAGMARWLIFKASTRRTFAAIGPDVVPDVIAVLAGCPTMALSTATASATGGPRTALDEQEAARHTEQMAKFVELGLVEPNGSHTAQPAGLEHSFNLTALFQQASFDYPFHNYADPAAIGEYQLLIESFLKAGAPPANQILFEGKGIELPPVKMDKPRQGAIGVETISYLLGHAFRPIGSIHTDSIECIRRTSPSGGARHPTEPVVVVRETMGGLPAGAYFYRSQDHSLVRVASEAYSPSRWPVEAPLSLVLWLKVERAMWRYRDLRALRPVLMDVGHIVETVSMLSSMLGISGIATAPPPVAQPLSEWLNGPAVASIHFQPTGVGPVTCCFGPDGAPAMATASPLLTSPAFMMAFDHGLQGRVLWPATRSFEMDLVDFKVVNHCLPSRRGDRMTTRDGICAAIPDATRAGIQRLVERGALLPAEVAEDFYKGARLWARYGWYFSCLAHLEAADAWLKDPPAPQPVGKDSCPLTKLSPLYARRTTRAFTKDFIALDQVLGILKKTFDAEPSVAPDGLQVFLSPTRVQGLEPGLYRWLGGLHYLGMPSERFRTAEGISSLVIGQFSAGAGALAIWMIARAATDSGAKYQDTIIRMGRLGQRLCIAATEAEIGVFLTPAITDALVAGMLNLEAPKDNIGYFFSMGAPVRQSDGK